MSNPIFYEDHVRLYVPTKAERNILFQSLLDDNYFEEVVMSIDEICVKFDPAIYDDEIITAIIKKYRPIIPISQENINHHILTVNFNNSLDMDRITAAMKMSESDFISWFLSQNFNVEMMGFQPGFAYLSHDGIAPNIDRLQSPRSKISAGSIGFRGMGACIYAHDGPGGWPIIGKIIEPIFDPKHNPPNLLQSGDIIRFKC